MPEAKRLFWVVSHYNASTDEMHEVLIEAVTADEALSHVCERFEDFRTTQNNVSVSLWARAPEGGGRLMFRTVNRNLTGRREAPADRRSLFEMIFG